MFIVEVAIPICGRGDKPFFAFDHSFSSLKQSSVGGLPVLIF